MTPRVLLKVERYGRYLHNFPVKKMTVGYKLTGKVYTQRIQIILTSEEIKIFDFNLKLLKNIPYKEIKECIEMHIAKTLNMPVGSWDYFWNDYNIIYIDDFKEETYILFWSNWAGWQKRLHDEVFKNIHEQIKIAHLKENLLKIAQEYDDRIIPISRIKEEFPLETIEVYRRINRLRDPDFEFVLSQDNVQLKPKLKKEDIEPNPASEIKTDDNGKD